MKPTLQIAVLPGDGIGPEIMAEAFRQVGRGGRYLLHLPRIFSHLVHAVNIAFPQRDYSSSSRRSDFLTSRNLL